MSILLRFLLLSRAFLAIALAFAVPASAGVVDGVKTVDGLTVYLGVVPAAVTRAHPQEHAERTLHDGIARPTVHDVHLLVAVFNSASGARLKNLG